MEECSLVNMCKDNKKYRFFLIFVMTFIKNKNA